MGGAGEGGANEGGADASNQVPKRPLSPSLQHSTPPKRSKDQEGLNQTVGNILIFSMCKQGCLYSTKEIGGNSHEKPKNWLSTTKTFI